MSSADLEPDAARCRLFARGSQPGFAVGAVGSPDYVAGALGGAALGATIGGAVRENRNFNDCMEARGWRIADTAAPTAHTTQTIRNDRSAAESPAPIQDGNFPQFKHDKFVASGERLQIGYFYSLKPDCTPNERPVIRITSAAAHGTVTIENAVGYPNYPASNVRLKCNLTESPISALLYQSRPGFVGADTTAVEVKFTLGDARTDVYNLVVK